MEEIASLMVLRTFVIAEEAVDLLAKIAKHLLQQCHLVGVFYRFSLNTVFSCS